MKKATLALAAVAAMGGLAASTAPASAWHWGHPHRRVVRVVAPVPFIAPVVVVPQVVYRAPVRTVRTVVYRAPVKRVKRVVVYR